jgi:hypothetical protein
MLTNFLFAKFTGLVVEKYPNIDDRRRAVDKLTASDRSSILRAHPMISARVHEIQQDLFFKFILMGKDKPFGNITDFWRRVEFQEKGQVDFILNAIILFGTFFKL